uniref:RRM domain-containing protein n=1 Tax=Tetradesmus obliquus TaxID=3088 RepID=A0A383W493_TETOB|eukprot:jgi/Sobl393_1/3349/SZX72465.1
MASAHGVIYVSNLPYEAHEELVQQAFEDEQFAVGSVQLLKKGSFNRCRNSGLACVTLAKRSDTERCCSVMDGKPLYGRPMIVRKDKFVADDPAYDSCTARDDTTAAAAAEATAAGGGQAGDMETAAAAAAAGSALTAVQHVKGAAAKAKQQGAPANCAAAAAAAATGGSRPTSSSHGGGAVRFVD